MTPCNKPILAAILVAFLICVFAGTSFTQPMVGADLLMKSKYVWRGMPFNPDPVLWPDVWVYWNNFTFIYFGSMEMTDVYEKKNKFTEVDYYFDYTRAFGGINASIGYAHYTYPNTEAKTTGEIYLKGAKDFPLFSFALTGYLDVMEAEGFYITPSLSKPLNFIPLQPTFTLSAGYGSEKHNAYYFGLEEGGFTDLTTGLSFAYTPSAEMWNAFTFGLDLNYATILDSDLADMWEDESNFFWGLSVNYSRVMGGE